MIAFILTNWKSLLAVIATAGLAYLLHSIDVYRLEEQQRAAIAAAQQQVTAQCDQGKQITEGVSNAYQTNLSALNSQFFSDLGGLRGQSVPINMSSAGNTPRHDASPKFGKHVIAHGSDCTAEAPALYRYARDAEQYRLQLISCQAFITQAWAVQGQR